MKNNEALKTIERKDMYDWTPIGEGKPPIGMPLIVTIYDSIRNRRELRYPVYYQKSMWNNNYCFCLFGNEEQILLPDYSRVIAWRYFPEIWEGEEE